MTQKQRGTTKNDLSQQDTIQSTKSTVEEGLRAINNLDHAQRLQRKESLIPCTECSLLLNALLFLSFQIVQKGHRGANHMIFFVGISFALECSMFFLLYMYRFLWGRSSFVVLVVGYFPPTFVHLWRIAYPSYIYQLIVEWKYLFMIKLKDEQMLKLGMQKVGIALYTKSTMVYAITQDKTH